MREALEFHLEGLAMNGDSLPVALTRLVEVPEDGLAEWLEVDLPKLRSSGSLLELVEPGTNEWNFRQQILGKSRRM